MPNYQNGKIYEVICSETGNIYIGSTTQSLNVRLSKHHCKSNGCSSKTFINPKIYLLENVSCNSKAQLEAIERKYVENNQCVNKRIPTRTLKEYREENKNKIKEEKKEYDKKYREENKEKLSKYFKEYKLENKEKLNEKKREKFECDCGAIISHGNRSRHERTQKHITFSNNFSA